MPTGPRPGAGVYVTNGSAGTYTHGQPVKEGNFVGVAVKQKNRTWKDGFAVQKLIDVSEPYFLVTKGELDLPNTGISGATKGAAVYIDAANALTTTVGANTKFGRVTDTAGTRGLPTGRCRIDLDAKDSF